MQDHPFFDDPDPGDYTMQIFLISAILVFGVWGIKVIGDKSPPAETAPVVQSDAMFTKEMAKAFSERAIFEGQLTHVSEQSDETIAVFAYQGNIFTVTFPKGTTEKRVRAYVDQVRAARPPCRPKGSVWRCLTNEVGCAEPVTVRGEPLCEVACPHIT